MNAQKLEKVIQGILDRTKFDAKKAHRLALAALTGRVCPLCDGREIVHSDTLGAAMGGVVVALEVVCPVCVSVEEARQ